MAEWSGHLEPDPLRRAQAGEEGPSLAGRAPGDTDGHQRYIRVESIMELLPSGTADPHTRNTGLACTLAPFMAISKPLIKWPFRLSLGWPGGHQQAWKAEWSPHADLEAQPQVGSPASKASLVPASCTTAYTKYLPARCAAPNAAPSDGSLLLRSAFQCWHKEPT